MKCDKHVDFILSEMEAENLSPACLLCILKAWDFSALHYRVAKSATPKYKTIRSK